MGHVALNKKDLAIVFDGKGIGENTNCVLDFLACSSLDCKNIL